MKIIFTRGIIASGKSTWSKQFVKDNQTYKRVNRDDLRHMISSYSYTKDNENLITTIEDDIIETLLKKGYNVIIDRQNLNQEQLDENIIYYKNTFGVDVEIKNFPITLEEAIERASKRELVIGENVIRDTWRRYENLLNKLLLGGAN